MATYLPEKFESHQNDEILLSPPMEYWGKMEFFVIPLSPSEKRPQWERFPVRKDKQIQEMFPKGDEALNWYNPLQAVDRRGFQDLVHFLIYKEENRIRKIFIENRAWEVTMALYYTSPVPPKNWIGDGDMLGVFNIPGAFMQWDSLRGTLNQRAQCIMHISPLVKAKDKKFYEASVIFIGTRVLVKIPRLCVEEHGLNLGLARFEVLFLMNRTPFSMIHAHVETLFETGEEICAPGASHMAQAWKELLTSRTKPEFKFNLEQLLCVYEDFL